jgi:hypothetical protein
MEDFAHRFGDIVRGLLSLEVNTIIKEGMSATRMGTPLDALGDIATDYATWLQDYSGTFDPPPAPVTASYFLDTLAAKASGVRAAHPGSGGVAIMATRIETNSRHLSSIFAKVTGPDPDPDEIVQLRKVWEIGTEEVVMQTVLWVDGDATHRIHPAYADKAHEQLLSVHSASVSLSLSHWKSLGELIMGLFKSAWQQLTAK